MTEPLVRTYKVKGIPIRVFIDKQDVRNTACFISTKQGKIRSVWIVLGIKDLDLQGALTVFAHEFGHALSVINGEVLPKTRNRLEIWESEVIAWKHAVTLLGLETVFELMTYSLIKYANFLWREEDV